jgi:hypothetical protein
MKRFFLIIVISLLTFSLVRALNGSEPLTLSGFLDALSELDFSFKYTKGVVEYMKDLSFDFTIDGVEELLQLIRNFFKAIFSPLVILCSVIMDVGALLSSILNVITKCLGFNIFGDGTMNPASGAGSGHGGGGGGIR